MSNQEIARQDLVDNSIFELLNKVNPSKRKIEWDIELIGEVRDVVSNLVASKLNLCSEKKFYPFEE